MDDEIKNIPLYIERNPKLIAKFKKEETFNSNCFRTTSTGKTEVFIPEKVELFCNNTNKKKKAKSLMKSNKEEEILHEIDGLEPYSIEKKSYDEDYD